MYGATTVVNDIIFKKSPNIFIVIGSTLETPITLTETYQKTIQKYIMYKTILTRINHV